MINSEWSFTELLQLKRWQFQSESSNALRILHNHLVEFKFSPVRVFERENLAVDDIQIQYWFEMQDTAGVMLAVLQRFQKSNPAMYLTMSASGIITLWEKPDAPQQQEA